VPTPGPAGAFLRGPAELLAPSLGGDGPDREEAAP